jgi:hypothetical protein
MINYFNFKNILLNSLTINSFYETGTKKEATLAGRLFQFVIKTKISFYPRITS